MNQVIIKRAHNWWKKNSTHIKYHILFKYHILNEKNINNLTNEQIVWIYNKEKWSEIWDNYIQYVKVMTHNGKVILIKSFNEWLMISYHPPISTKIICRKTK